MAAFDRGADSVPARRLGAHAGRDRRRPAVRVPLAGLTAPDLTVVVVTHDGREKALATLRSAHDHAGDRDVEWIVIDSGSSDGTPEEIARRWPDVLLTRCPNVGFAAAVNVALPTVTGRYVLMLNPDVEILSGTLADLVAALDRRPGVGAAGVTQRDAGGELLPSIGRFPSPARQLAEALLPGRLLLRRLHELSTPRPPGGERSVDWVAGAFLMVRAEALRQVGGLDERFFLYSEEVDLAYRLRAGGWDVRHLPALTVLHHVGDYSRPGLSAQLAHSKLLFARKHYGRRRRVAMQAALAAGHAIRLVAVAPGGLVRRGLAERRRDEAAVLAVALGLRSGPFQGRRRPPGS